MAAKFPSQLATSYRQVLLQEQAFGEQEAMEGIMDEFDMDAQRDHLTRYPSGLKINEERLFRYGPRLPSTLAGVPNNQTSKLECGGKLIHKQVLKSSNSSTLKSPLTIKHKVAPKACWLKTESDKENMPLLELPKMGSLNRNKQSILNKTTSSIALHGKSVKGNQDTLTYKRRCDQPAKHCRDDEKGLKIASSRASNSKQALSKIASLTKFKHGSSEAQTDAGCQSGGIVTALTQISSKQEDLIQQKRQLEQRVKALRSQIEKQSSQLEEIAQRKQRMRLQMNRQAQHSHQSQQGAKLSKKKNEKFFSQTKMLQSRLTEVVQANRGVLASIQEQKELIRMYQRVIEEVKGHLRVERQEKQQLQRQLATMRKLLGSLEARAESQEASNREVVRKIYASLEQWQC